MPHSIGPANVRMPSWLLQPSSPETGSSTEGVDFRRLLFGTLQETASIGQQAKAAVEESLAGGDITRVEVLTAVKKADLSLRLLLQVRNKSLEAFNEIKQLRM